MRPVLLLRISMSVSLDCGQKSPKPRNRPLQADLADRDAEGDIIVADVVDFEIAVSDVAHQHVGGVGAVKAAETGDLQLGQDLAERVGRQDRIVADIIDFVGAVGVASA